MLSEFKLGIRNGIPIALGYFTVSIAFGIYAAKMRWSVYGAGLLSLSNLSSAGQFAGLKILDGGSNYLELFVSVFVINVRYILMAIVLAQKLAPMPLRHKMILGYGITDEIFALAIKSPVEVNFSYFMGLTLLPAIGWTSGTIVGVLFGNVLPSALVSAFGITLYCMFIAVLVPGAKGNLKIFRVTAIAILLSSVLAYCPYTSNLQFGWRVVLTVILASGISVALDVVAERSSDLSKVR
ncbi:MAG: AzlC family ABC transporter permease [Eubacteriales bacterium]|nr:AzlC family ABC transporter permease [Eubacteriales bacterium]